MALGGQSLAGLARVSYEAVGLADFAADNQRAETSYRQSVSGMSDAAIRLELAQDRLRRSLQKGPSAFREQARAELSLRRETDALTRSQDRSNRGFANLRRGLVMYTGAILGGAGLVAGIRGAITAASGLEEATNKTLVTFRESGAEVVQWSRTTATTMALASDQALKYASTLGGILNVSGLARDESAKLSMELVELAGDMSSFNDVPITEALEALRAGLVGESEPLRRLQVLLSETRVKQEAYASGIAKTGTELTEQQKVLARYRVILKDTADQQGDHARTSDSLARSTATLTALWREAQILVGQALAPAFTDAVQGLRDWLSNAENQKTLQREINTIVGDGVTVVKAFADVLGFAKDAATPLVNAVGGLGNAIKIMAGAWLLFKARALLGFAGTAAASRATAASMVRDAAVAGRAWDVATRPRVMPVTTIGGGAPAPGGGKGRIPILGVTGPQAIVVAAAIAAYFGIRANQSNPVSPEQFQRMREAAGRGGLSREQLRQLSPFLRGNQEAELRRLIAVAQARGGGAAASPDSRGGARGPGAVAAEQERDRKRNQRRGAFTFGAFEAWLAGINEQALDAESTSGTSDDVRVERARLALARRALGELKLTIEQRMQVKQERNRALQALAAIEAAEEQESQRINDERDRKRAEARKRADERRKRMEDAADKASEERMKLLRGTGGSRQNMRAQALRHVEDVVAGVKRGAGRDAADKPLTKAELERALAQWLTSLHGVISQFGSDITSGADLARIATHSSAQTDLLLEQNRQLGLLSDGMWFPGTGYSKTQLSAHNAGVGF